MRTPNTTCATCGKPIYRQPSTLARTRNAYCSRKCQGAPKPASLPRQMTCPTCGATFEVAFGKKRKFCSRACANKGRRGIQYTGSRKVNLKTTLLLELRRRSGSKCCMVKGCSYNRTLDLHRLVPGKEGGLYEVGNAFSLCPNHHAEFHRGLISLSKVSDFELEAVDLGFPDQLAKFNITGSDPAG